jgi:Pyruvate/2-oxoacid:ferredoxin oxidoreductase delta subunit
VRALRALGIEPGRSFSAKVLYVYRKQLEEAGHHPHQQGRRDRAGAVGRSATRWPRVPGGTDLRGVGRTGQGMDAWIDVLTRDEAAADADLDIDYAAYGEGEALLGWVNAPSGWPARTSTATPSSGRRGADRRPAERRRHRDRAPEDDAVAGGGDADLAVLNQVRNEHVAELSHSLDGELSRGELIVNLRAEGDPRASPRRSTATARRGRRAEPGHQPWSTPSTSGPDSRTPPTGSRRRSIDHAVARPVLPLCAFAQAVPRPVKQDVLRALTDRGDDFDAVADLCEMSARKDPALKEFAACETLTLVACYPASAALAVQRRRRAARRSEGAGAEHARRHRPSRSLPGSTAPSSTRPTRSRSDERRRSRRDRRCSSCLYEGAGAMPLDGRARFEITRALLEKGYRSSPRAPDAAARRRASGRCSCSAASPARRRRKPSPAPAPRSTSARSTASSRPASSRSSKGVGGDAQTQKPGGWKPWFPVIDYSRCTNCMQCLSFCLFDVYGVSKDKQIEVQRQTNCKTDCPACSRVCPEVAILFPKYKAGPINGDEVNAADLEREKMKVDISALLGGDIYAALRQRSQHASSRFARERDDQRALEERKKCLAKLQAALDIPAEVMNALPTADDIRAKAARWSRRRDGDDPLPGREPA